MKPRVYINQLQRQSEPTREPHWRCVYEHVMYPSSLIPYSLCANLTDFFSPLFSTFSACENFWNFFFETEEKTASRSNFAKLGAEQREGSFANNAVTINKAALVPLLLLI